MPRRWRWVASAFGMALVAQACLAEFALGVSPPRFELQGRSGQVLRQALTLSNGSSRMASFQVSTADWRLAADGTVTFSEALAEGSCRPWVAIERRDLKVAPGGQYRFRFEVALPPDAEPRECRFALMFEGEGDAADLAGVRLPIAARVAVVVYLGVNGVQPRLSVMGGSVVKANGLWAPALDIRNDGDAHGRLDGFLSGLDARQTRLDLRPANTPVLPGEIRTIVLVPSRSGSPETQSDVAFPVQVKGRLEWGHRQTIDVDLRIDRPPPAADAR
jgi:hypothetical protein